MKRRFLLLAAGLVAGAPQARASDPPAAAGPNAGAVISLRLRGGTRIAGMPASASLAFESSVGRLDIPWPAIERIDFDRRAGEWKLRSGKLTSIRGRPADGVLDVIHRHGKSAIPMDEIESIEPHLPGAPTLPLLAGTLPRPDAALVVDLTDGTRLVGVPGAGGLGIHVPGLGEMTLPFGALRTATNDIPNGRISATLADGDVWAGRLAPGDLQFESTVGTVRLGWNRILTMTLRHRPDAVPEARQKP